MCSLQGTRAAADAKARQADKKKKKKGQSRVLSPVALLNRPLHAKLRCMCKSILKGDKQAREKVMLLSYDLMKRKSYIFHIVIDFTVITLIQDNIEFPKC